MSDSETGTRAADNYPACPTSVCSDPAVQRYVAEICKQQGWPPGKRVLIMLPDRTLCTCTCGGAAAAGGEGAALEPCSAERCRELRPYIDQACHDLGYPPGHRLLIANPDGTYCYCICGGA